MSHPLRHLWPLLAAVSLASAQPPPKTMPRPGDDFFTYANYEWLSKTEIPSDRSSWGVFRELTEIATARNKALLESSPQTLAGRYYAALLDEATIESRGAKPLGPVLARIDLLTNKRALARHLGEELRADVDPLNMTNFHTTRLFGLFVSPDFHGPRNTAYLLQGGLGLPDREYYTSQAKDMVETRDAYAKHIAALFELAGLPDGPARAARVLALETKIAAAHVSREDSLDVRKADNPWKRTELARKAPGLDWAAFLGGAGLAKLPVLVAWHPQATTALSALVASEPLDAWKDWLRFHAIDRASPYLPRAFVQANFAFHDRVLSGTPELAARWKRGVAFTNDALPDAVGRLYVEKHFPPASKAQVETMVKHIVAAFEKRVDQLDWMDPKTRARAKQKLGTLYVGIGYAGSWDDYKGLEILADDAYGNWERAERYATKRAVARLGKPADNTMWWMSPQTVNAVNLPLQNALNFPAAILNPPFFDPQAASASNYGAIGAVIGHEISHSFDDQGAQFDEKGKLTDWWTKEDRAHFEKSGAALVAQYDAYKPFPDLAVNGKLTLSENIADLAGLAAAHDGWLASLGRKATREEEQQFFLAWARAWRTKYRDAALRRTLITNGHSPGRYRASTVRNFDAWVEAFGVKPGEALFLAPADRVRVW
jgi:predicted metalloendopeptidase